MVIVFKRTLPLSHNVHTLRSIEGDCKEKIVCMSVCACVCVCVCE